MSSVVFLCHPYHRGGVTSWMASAAKESAKQGVKTYFITVEPISPFISAGDRPTMLEFIGRNPIPNLEIIATKVNFTFELGTEEYKSIIYRNLITKNIPKGTPIIVSDGFAVWQAAALVADEYPMIAVLHSDDNAYYYLASRFHSYVSGFTAVSKRVADKASLPNNKIDVIPCGIDTSLFQDKQQINKEQLEIVWVGRIEEEQKRVSDIIKIAELLNKHRINFNIKVLGTGPQYDLLSESVRKSNLGQYITLLGWQSNQQIIEILGHSRMLLQTSNYEGMSVAVMEALASGCGVVSSRVSGVEDYENLSISANCMRLYTIGDIDEAVQQIISLSSISTELCSNTAQLFAEQEFSIQSCLHKYQGMIRVINEAQSQNNKFTFSLPSIFLSLKSYLLASLRLLKYKALK